MNPASDSPSSEHVVTRRGGLHLISPHPPKAYADVRCIEVPGWDYFVLVPDDGKPFHALGGERLLSYRTPTGGEADGFDLQPGDRVTRVRTGLRWQFAEWRIERA
jgi:hypothetical protein